MSKANETQVGGDHYRSSGADLQHWDIVAQLGMGYYDGQITKYVSRWRKKNGRQDLLKAEHFLIKYIECMKVPNTMLHTTAAPLWRARNKAADVLVPLFCMQQGLGAWEQEVLMRLCRAHTSYDLDVCLSLVRAGLVELKGEGGAPLTTYTIPADGSEPRPIGYVKQGD